MLWATKRRLIYGGIAFLVLAIILSIFYFKIFYTAPVCNDGKQNGDETGVDCGGKCPLLCRNDTLAPVIHWSKIFNISGDLYTAMAYVENSNVNSENPKVGYEFRIYDEKNNLLETRSGYTYIPKNKKFAVFEPGFVIKNRKPKRAEFSFTSFSPWQKNESKESEILITHTSLMSTSSAPKIEGKITNSSLNNLGSVELVGIVSDSKENAIAVSRTFVENLKKRSSQDFIFTWPKPFDLGVEACSDTLDIALVLDKSGSMKSESSDPPEPFNTVKNTAKSFISNLSDSDQVSIISFSASGTKESNLFSDKKFAQSVIDGISISTSTNQTNITEGLSYAFEELKSPNSSLSNRKIIILLTDGVPTEPKKVGEPDYPKISAQSMARNISQSNMKIYVIGLGNAVSEGFLMSLVENPDDYMFAPNKDMLPGVYRKISNSVCEKKPSLINIIYRITPSL